MRVNIEDMKQGAVVTVTTINNVYGLTVQDAKNRLVQVDGSGCYSGEANVLNHFIEEGAPLFLGTLPDGRLIRTSLVQKISVN